MNDSTRADAPARRLRASQPAFDARAALIVADKAARSARFRFVAFIAAIAAVVLAVAGAAGVVCVVIGGLAVGAGIITAALSLAKLHDTYETTARRARSARADATYAAEIAADNSGIGADFHARAAASQNQKEPTK